MGVQHWLKDFAKERYIKIWIMSLLTIIVMSWIYASFKGRDVEAFGLKITGSVANREAQGYIHSAIFSEYDNSQHFENVEIKTEGKESPGIVGRDYKSNNRTSTTNVFADTNKRPLLSYSPYATVYIEDKSGQQIFYALISNLGNDVAYDVKINGAMFISQNEQLIRVTRHKISFSMDLNELPPNYSMHLPASFDDDKAEEVLKHKLYLRLDGDYKNDKGKMYHINLWYLYQPRSKQWSIATHSVEMEELYQKTKQ